MKDILLINLSCIGDVLLTTPVIQSLKDNFPDSKITVVAGPTAMAILQNHKCVDIVIPFYNKGEHKGVLGASRLCFSLRKLRYDMVIDLRNTAMPYFLKARYKIKALSSHAKNRDNMTRHAIDRHLDIIESAGIKPTTREMSVFLTPESIEKAETLLREAGLADQRPVAVYPGAGSDYKIYPIEKMASALDQISAERSGTRYIAIGSQADAAICEKLAELSGGRCVSMAGKMDILGTGALISKCGILISNDSGPMHLGAAIGTPTVAIFGPTNADRYGPRGPAHRIVWRKEHCNPCKSPECGMESCIVKIDPMEIAAAALELLRATDE